MTEFSPGSTGSTAPVPPVGGAPLVDLDGTHIMSPEFQAVSDLRYEAEKVLSDIGVTPTSAEELSAAAGMYGLRDGDVVEARAFSPEKNEAIARIRLADGQVVHRHDSYFHGSKEEGSFVTMWHVDESLGDNVVHEGREAAPYGQLEMHTTDIRTLEAGDVEGLVEGFKYAYPKYPDDHPKKAGEYIRTYSREVHLMPRRMHNLLGKAAVYAGFGIRMPAPPEASAVEEDEADSED